MICSRFIAAILLSVLLISGALAQRAGTEQKPGSQDRQESQAQTGLARHLPEASTTQHSIGDGPNRLNYTATAGTLPLMNDKGDIAASVFYVAYSTGEPGRPVSFVFNGGPGAASAFLHLGGLGPKVLEFQENGSVPQEPLALSENPNSWLPFTDLVFVDPVGTGFSRAAGGTDAGKAYYGVDQDVDAMADFAHLYLTRADRALSPIFLVGESYGGFRAAMLAERLLKDGLRVKGVLLISAALEFSLIRGDEFALVPLALQLPAITASYVERTGGADAPFTLVQEAEQFARSEYLLHLVQGLNPSETVIAKLAKLTGLDAKAIARNHGRVTNRLFLEEYSRNEDRVLSLYDGAISAPVPKPASGRNFDPILDAAVTALTPLMVDYTRDELGFKTDLPYNLLNRRLNRQWDYGVKQGFAGSLDELQNARSLNRGLKIFIAHGYTDLVTPYTHSEFLVSQLPPIDGARPIELRVYRGGHMMYMRPDSRRALTTDAAKIYQ